MQTQAMRPHSRPGSFGMEPINTRKIKCSFSKAVEKENTGGPGLCRTNPNSHQEVMGKHLLYALIGGIPLFLAGIGSIDLLPSIKCLFLKITSIPCPFCGFTRSFYAASRGDWAFAAYNSPLACLIYMLAIVMFIWNLSGILLGANLNRGRLLRLKPFQRPWVVYIVASLFLLNWIYRLNLGLK